MRLGAADAPMSALTVLALSSLSRRHAICDVTSEGYGAVGDGVAKDTRALRSALAECDEVWLPAGRSFLSGPVNLTSNQVLRVDGTLLASADPADYPMVAPLLNRSQFLLYK